MKQVVTFLVLILSTVFLFLVPVGNCEDIPLMTTDELRPLLGNPDIYIIDVRSKQQWKASSDKIPGAEHENPLNVSEWIHKYSKEKTIIIY